MTKKKDFRAIAIAHMETLNDHVRETGITQQDIADVTGFAQSNVNRMFTGKYVPKLDNFIKLLDVAGLEIIIQPIKSK